MDIAEYLDNYVLTAKISAKEGAYSVFSTLPNDQSGKSCNCKYAYK